MLVVGVILILLGIILNLGAYIAQIADAFKTHVGWGLISVLGFFALGGIPNFIYILTNLKERHPPLVMWLGSWIPIIVGVLIFVGEMLVQKV